MQTVSCAAAETADDFIELIEKNRLHSKVCRQLFFLYKNRGPTDIGLGFYPNVEIDCVSVGCNC